MTTTTTVLHQIVPEVVVEVVDLALEGSEYAIEAWQILRRAQRRDTLLEPEELETFEELLDRARDDIDGPGLRVDLEIGRIY